MPNLLNVTLFASLLALLGGRDLRASDNSGLAVRERPKIEPLAAEAVDELIEKRIEKSLARLRQHPEHQSKSETELLLRARVGKMTPSDFSDRVSAPSDFTEALFQEYRRIWYLADDAYKAIASRKFNPDRALIPYLDSSVASETITWLLPLFEAELKQERKDPRALGHECSELLKLQVIVDRLRARSAV